MMNLPPIYPTHFNHQAYPLVHVIWSSAMPVLARASTAATASPADGGSCDQHGTTMPLRVIDVEATIKNRKAGGICFTRSPIWHVISHTWSADIREFSKIIGERLKGAAARGDGRSYGELFEAAGFHNHPSYQKLVELLIMLRADAVRWVWFDAVCINQTDLKEKDEEILQMGTYYESSVGCHVVHHGIGKGFELVLGDGEDVLPRWFSRAWTFQEWVLPRKTTFIIDLALQESLRKTANTILLAYAHTPNRKCACCEYEVSLDPQFVRECMRSYIKAKDGTEEEDLSSSSARVQRFCSFNFGDPHFRKIPGRRRRAHRYLTDDLGYVFLFRVKLQMKNAGIDDRPGMSNVSGQIHAFSDAEFELINRLGLKVCLSGHSRFYGSISKEEKMPLVIEEISVRNCSNPEDRVLSVLKLMGVEGAIQVRSGKSLEAQLLHLARSLVEKREHNEMLLRMCLVDGFGNDTPGMSWAPHFEVKGSWQEGVRQLSPSSVIGAHFERFKAEAEVREVSSSDGLRVESGVCAGQLICCDHDHQSDFNRKPDEQFRTMGLEVDGQVVLSLCARVSAAVARDACVLVNRSVDESNHGRTCIAFTAPGIHNRLHQLRERIPVWLVKMGVGEHGSSVVTYFLVCVGDQLGSPLHKIGYVGITLSVTEFTLEGEEQIMFCRLETKQTMCCIGGLGSDLSKYLIYAQK